MGKLIFVATFLLSIILFQPKTIIPKPIPPPQEIIIKSEEIPIPSPEIPSKVQDHPLVIAHNKIRKSYNLPPLKQDADLMKYAQLWANHMAQTNIMKHQRLSGKAMGENIAMGQQSIEEVMNAWMKSSGHKANILRNYTTIGIGVAEKNNIKFWCVDFGYNKN